MASLFAHAAVPLIAHRAFAWPAGMERRVAVAAALVSIWPDADLLTLAFEIRPNEPLGHRGLFHSLIVTGAVALIVAAIAFRKVGLKAWGRIALFLLAAALSHGLLDAMTAGDVGVALFAPLEWGRHLLPFKLVAVCPAGLNEYLSAWGALTIANELLYIVIPLALVVTFFRPDAPRGRLLLFGVLLAIVVPMLRAQAPGTFTPIAPKVIGRVGTDQAGKYDDIPHADLPDGRLVTKLAELRTLNLVGVPLAPGHVPWSSSFFPSWFGSWAGRWQDGAPKLAARTLFGVAPPTEADAHAWLAAGDAQLFKLAPTEKVDLALARFDFPVTKQGLERTHNAVPKPRYWFGLCNGAAAAAIALPEPYRAVDVAGMDGSHVRFHPNDVKALLALAYDEPGFTIIGEVCSKMAFDPVATCSMNPAVLAVTAMNRLGIAKKSFLVDALPSIAKQYYAVAEARVNAGEPYPPNDVPIEKELAGKIASFVDVEIVLTLSSTTLSYSKVNRVDEKVGLVPVVMRYTATLALDKDTEILGGRWTGDPADGPDDVLIVGEEPKLVPGGKLKSSYRLPWAFVKELARVSADENVPATLDVKSLNL